MLGFVGNSHQSAGAYGSKSRGQQSMEFSESALLDQSFVY